MPHILLTRFERRVLRPIWVLHGALVILLFVRGHFLAAALLTVLWLGYGMAGQALHRNLTAQQLARGEHVTRPEDGSEFDELSVGDSNQLGKAMIAFAITVSLTTVVVAFQLGARWFLAIPLGLACIFVIPIVSFVLAGGDAAFRVWRQRRREQNQ